jgi:Strictosidine synthase-like, N-terminal
MRVWAKGRSPGPALLVALVVAMIAAPAANAELAYDEELSLTGGCTTSALDTVADPSCPYAPFPAGPSAAFASPFAATSDEYGNLYVSNYGKASADGAEGRIDIFDPEGFFLFELKDEDGPEDLALDSAGNLYIFEYRSGIHRRVVRCAPEAPYEPQAGKVAYQKPCVTVITKGGSSDGIAVNSADDHLFVHGGGSIWELGSAEEGNPVIEEGIGSGQISTSSAIGLDVDATHNRLYAGSETCGETCVGRIEVFELEAPHALIETIDGAGAPPGKFRAFLSVAADESNGHAFIYDGEGANRVFEYGAEGEYLGSPGFQFNYVPGSQIAIDNGKQSPNGALADPEGRCLFVASHPTGLGHAFAFCAPPDIAAPEVISTSFEGVTDSEAQLRATINPGNLDTTYTFHYTTQADYEKEGGFGAAALAREGTIAAGDAPVDVSASLAELQPGTTYRFHLQAENQEGEDEGEGALTTYPPAAPPGACANEALRTGPSALLPDCRAYELVSPPDTNGRTPLALGITGSFFPTRLASPGAGKVSFTIQGGAIPGFDVTGSWAGDPYLASRGTGGWSTASAGPSGAESVTPLPGGISPDQGHSFWQAGGGGSAMVEGGQANYVRYPDGHSELLAQGSLGSSAAAEGKLISQDAGHILFTVKARLEPEAPGGGARVIYDRAGGQTRVVSLLAGETSPGEGVDAHYVGASPDGEGVAFKVGSTLYLRYRGSETFALGSGLEFAGIASGGARVFYLQGGDLWRFDAADESLLRFTEAGDVTAVNVGAQGSAAYFASPTALAGSGPNPAGAEPAAGEANLYLSREGQIFFLATVTERDLEGEFIGTEVRDGLGLWSEAVSGGSSESPARLGIDPSRTTPEGSVFVFQSRAELTDADPGGHVQVYRYDSAAQELACLSCDPTGAPTSGAGTLESIDPAVAAPVPFKGSYPLLANLRADGRRAFFQSDARLSLGDSDGLQDIYQWEDQGVGSCTRPGGCVELISSGRSQREDYLFALGDSGDDVFILSSDLLLGADRDETPSIYDARVGGGFAEALPPAPCEGEGCRPRLSAPPALPVPGSLAGRPGNRPKRCPKAKRRVRRAGKVRCVGKKHRHRGHHRHRRAKPERRAGR